MQITILGIIPARGGSKGLPGKNIKVLADKPLIAHTIKAALNSRWLTEVVVSTDDEHIAEISREYGAEVPYKRPEELSDDTATSVDVVIYHLEYLKAQGKQLPDYVCLLQCTTPFRTEKAIDQAIVKCIEADAPACVSVVEVEKHPQWMVNIDREEKLHPFIPSTDTATRRQDLPKVYQFNGAIYLIRTDVFLNQKIFTPEGTLAYQMSAVESVDIDTLLDFKYCEMLYESGSV